MTKSLLTEMMQVFLLRTDEWLFSNDVFQGDAKGRRMGGMGGDQGGG